MTNQYQVAGSLISSREAAIRAAIESWAGDTSASEWTEDQIREYLPGWCKAPEGVDQAELDAEVVQTAIAMMHAAATIPADLIEALPAGVSLEDCTVTTARELYERFEIDRYAVDDDDAVVLVPGWYADDGNAEVYYPRAESGEAAAREYVDGGDWGDRSCTDWIDVWAWRRAYALDEDGEVVTLALDRERHTIELPPDEPDCSEGREHDWHERGVRGHGGGVIITEVCAHCGRYMIIDTWAQRRDTGEQGLRSIEYREPDESSREWVEARRLEAVADDISDDYDARFDREERRVVIAAGKIDDDAAYDAANALEDRLGDDYFVTWSRDDDGEVRLYVRVA